MSKLKCGETQTYTNNSKQREYVRIVATNDCEYTAYLWIRFPNRKFIGVSIQPGQAFDQHDVLSPNGKVEFECSQVSQRAGGCDFSCTVVRRFD